MACRLLRRTREGNLFAETVPWSSGDSRNADLCSSSSHGRCKHGRFWKVGKKNKGQQIQTSGRTGCQEVQAVRHEAEVQRNLQPRGGVARSLTGFVIRFCPIPRCLPYPDSSTIPQIRRILQDFSTGIEIDQHLINIANISQTIVDIETHQSLKVTQIRRIVLKAHGSSCELPPDVP